MQQEIVSSSRLPFLFQLLLILLGSFPTPTHYREILVSSARSVSLPVAHQDECSDSHNAKRTAFFMLSSTALAKVDQTAPLPCSQPKGRWVWLRGSSL
jgi:hypothetical protein